MCRQQEDVNLDAVVEVYSFIADDPAMCCENILSDTLFGILGLG